MKNIYFLLFFAFLLTGCKSVNKNELLGEKPECTNKICDKTDVVIKGGERLLKYVEDDNIEGVSSAKDYKLEIYMNEHKNSHWTDLTTGLSFGILPLIGFPDYTEANVDIEATIKTKIGTPIKTYYTKGPIKSNVAAILYGYDISGAYDASIIESAGDAIRALTRQINEDNKIFVEAEKIRKQEEKEIKMLKNIMGGHRIVIDNPNSYMDPSFYYRGIASDIKNGDILYMETVVGPCEKCAFGQQMNGLFAGQNTYEGNLANYRTYWGDDKIFLYGPHDYVDGQPLKGFYRRLGHYSYTTVLGAYKTVPAFQRLDIPATLIKYVNIVKTPYNSLENLENSNVKVIYN